MIEKLNNPKIKYIHSNGLVGQWSSQLPPVEALPLVVWVQYPEFCDFFYAQQEPLSVLLFCFLEITLFSLLMT